MRLLFLCGSLDPGRDGVGDYVRTLARSCAELGAEVRAIAVNDPSAASTNEDAILRLSSTAPWSERLAAAERAIKDFAPDWVSLQFVPYAFQPRGFASPLNRLLRTRPGRFRHVMFHETWITSAPGASWKRRLTGFLQRRNILAMLRHFRPGTVHTSTAAYQRLLAGGANLRATLLPIFSSIPISPSPDGEWLIGQLRAAGVQFAPEAGPPPLLAGFFGTLYPEWEPAPLMAALATARRRCCFVAMGHMRDGHAVWERMVREHGHDHDFVALGSLAPEQISSVLTSLDMGVTSVPLDLVDKSSSTAAMLEHGLPVLVTRFNHPLPAEQHAGWRARGIYPLTPEVAQWLHDGLPKRPPRSQVPELRDRFLRDLSIDPAELIEHEH